MFVNAYYTQKRVTNSDSFLCISTVYITETSAFRFNHTLCA